MLSIEADMTKLGIGLVILSIGGERLDIGNSTSKLMLTILARVATWEREIMLERQRDGIAKAKAAGKYKCRPISIDAAQIKQSSSRGPRRVPLRSRNASALPGVRSTACSDRWREPARIQSVAISSSWIAVGRLRRGAYRSTHC
jgi:hypothetical protein